MTKQNAPVAHAELVGGSTTTLHSHAGGGGTLPTPVCVVLAADVAVMAWSNMPVALTEFRGLTIHRTKIDLTNASQVRLIKRQTVIGATNAQLRVQYSTDETAWYYMDNVDGPKVAIDAVNCTAGAWVNLVANAKADVYVRLIGINGDGGKDPAFGLIMLQIK